MNELTLDDLVQATKSAFKTWAFNLVMKDLVLSLPWLGNPLISWLVKLAVGKILDIMIKEGELGAFILNTKILTSSEARDYRDAAAKVLSLPADVDKAVWEAAEREANEKFDRLIRLSS